MHAKRRRAFTISAAAAALLVVPVAAEAATYNVAPGGGACKDPDLSCENLAEAAKGVAAGDTVRLGAGQFPGAAFDKAGVKIVGDTVAEGGLPTSQVTSTLEFSGGGTAEVSNVALSSAAGNGIDAKGATGLKVGRVIVLVGAGNAVNADEGASVTVTQSRLITASPVAAAIATQPSSGAAKTIVVENSILAGGGAGAGLRVDNSGLLAGSVDVQARHVTVAGSTNAFQLAANTTVLGGNITGAVTDSIISGQIALSKALVLNTVALDTGTRNDTTTAPAQQFVNPASRDYALLATAPAIDKGAPGGANDFDVDGQRRASGQPSDLGADEFFNSKPVAKAAATSPTGRQGRPVTFSAAGSVDRDGPLVGYVWTFSDGQKTTTREPTVTHSFAKEGRGGAALQVLDTSGAISDPALAAVNILDGLAPLVGIDAPKANKTLNRFKTSKKTKKKSKQAIKISGRAADKSGMKQVLVTIKQVSRTTSKAKSSQTSTRKCRWLKRSGVSVRSCSNPVLIGAKLAADGKWTYTIPASRIPVAGTYEVAAIGVDKSGAFGNSAPAKSGKIKFKLR